MTSHDIGLYYICGKSAKAAASAAPQISARLRSFVRYCAFHLFTNDIFVVKFIPCCSRAASSVGQSTRLITERSEVQIFCGPPFDLSRSLTHSGFGFFVCGTYVPACTAPSRSLFTENRYSSPFLLICTRHEFVFSGIFKGNGLFVFFTQKAKGVDFHVRLRKRAFIRK